MNNNPPQPPSGPGDIPPMPPGWTPPPPPPPGYGPPPGAGGPPPGAGGPPPGYGGPPPGYGGQMPGGPPPKKNWLPWALGCGGCGLLIVLAIVFFGAVGYFGQRQEAAHRAAGTDTTVVSDDTTGVPVDAAGGDTIPVIQPLDDQSSTDGGSQPTDAGSSEDGKPAKVVQP